MKLSIHEAHSWEYDDFYPVLYGKRETIKQFIDKAVSYFTKGTSVPTMEQIDDYVTADRWVKANISDGEVGYDKPGFESIPLEDLCKNILNLCSFNMDSVYESRSRKRIKESRGERHWLSTELEPPIAGPLKSFLRDRGIKFEPSSCGNLIHFEVFATPDEAMEIDNFIDSLDYSYITRDMMHDDL